MAIPWRYRIEQTACELLWSPMCHQIAGEIFLFIYGLFIGGILSSPRCPDEWVKGNCLDLLKFNTACCVLRRYIVNWLYTNTISTYLNMQ